MTDFARERPRNAQSLSTASLAAWESSNGPNPRRTVQHFVQNQSTQMYSPPPKYPERPGFDPDSSPPARHDLLARRADENDANGGKRVETAMVLGGKDTRLSETAGVQPRKCKESGGIGKVAAMKPRTSSNAVKSTPPLAEAATTTSQQPHRYSSPLVISRARREDRSVEKENLGPSTRMERQEKGATAHESPVKKVKRTREVIVVPVRSLPRPSTSKLEKRGSSSEEDEEHVERLAARKSRRRAKALIVKDRTTTPAETGAAAASKVKKSRRVAKNVSDGESEVETRGRKKKGNKGMEAVKESLKARERAGNVAEKRLTLPPAVKLGLFAKGVASARTKVTKKQPRFSELAFLNAPRRSPSPESAASSSNSSSDSSAPPVKSKAKLAPIFGKLDSKKSKAKVTYKSQSKRKSSSKYFDAEEEKEEEVSDVAPPPTKKIRKEPDPPTKSKSRKDVLRESEAPPQRLTRKQGADAASLSAVSRASDHSAFSNLVAERGATGAQGEELMGSIVDSDKGEDMIIDIPPAWKELGNAEGSRVERRRTQPVVDSLARSESATYTIPPLLSPRLSNSDHSLSVLSFPPDSLSPPTAIIQEGAADRYDTPDTLDRLLRACETGELTDSPAHDQPSFSEVEEQELVPQPRSDPLSFEESFSHTDSAVLRDPGRMNENLDEMGESYGDEQDHIQHYSRVQHEAPRVDYDQWEADDEPQLFGDFDSQEDEGGFVIEEGVAGSAFQSALHQPWNDLRQSGGAEERRNYSEAMKSHWRKAKP